MFRLAYFVSHPIHYQVPLLRQIAANSEIDLTVFFYTKFSIDADPKTGFNRSIEWDIPLLEGYRYQFLDCWNGNPRHPWLIQPIAKNSLNLLELGNFDAVWMHGWYWFCGLQVIWAAHRLGIPVLMRGDSNGLRKPPNGFKRHFKQLFLQWLFPKISAFLYIGSLNYQFYINHGIKEEQLFFTPYAVDNAYFQRQSQLTEVAQAELRRSLDLAPDRPVILFAARMVAEKSPQDLLAAYRLLSPDGVKEPEPYLLLVGDGVLKPGLEDQAKEIGWSSIRFFGFRNQSEMPKLYALCDVFVLPSKFEPWGLVINEVMNAGKAVVASDQVGCVPDLIRDRVNGRVFPVGNIQALAAAIQWSIEHCKAAGVESFRLIHNWNYERDVAGLKQALSYVTGCGPFC